MKKLHLNCKLSYIKSVLKLQKKLEKESPMCKNNTFTGCVRYLLEIAKENGRTLYIRKDFAPYSFDFAIRDIKYDNRAILPGGIICHCVPGCADPLAVSLSVELDNNNKTHWEIHT